MLLFADKVALLLDESSNGHGSKLGPQRCHVGYKKEMKLAALLVMMNRFAGSYAFNFLKKL